MTKPRARLEVFEQDGREVSAIVVDGERIHSLRADPADGGEEDGQ